MSLPRGGLGLLLTIVLMTPTLAQMTEGVEFVGYIAEEGHPLTAIECALEGYEWWTDPDRPIMFCDGAEDYVAPVSCRNDILFYVTEHITAASTSLSLPCTGGCTQLTVVQEWPGDGVTRTIYDCISNLAGLDPDVDVDTIYRVIPDEFVTEGSVSAEDASSTAEPGPTTETQPDPTQTDENGDGDGGDDDDGGGTSAGVIAGAAVGGVAGLSLIAAAIFIGVRIGKKRAARAEAAQEVTHSSFASPQPPALNTPHMVQSSTHSSPFKSHQSPAVISIDQPAYTHWDPHQVAQQMPSPSVGTPTGNTYAQPWHPHEASSVAYEMDSSAHHNDGSEMGSGH